MVSTVQVRCLRRFTYPVSGPQRKYRDINDEFEMTAKDLQVHCDLLRQVEKVADSKKSVRRPKLSGKNNTLHLKKDRKTGAQSGNFELPDTSETADVSDALDQA